MDKHALRQQAIKTLNTLTVADITTKSEQITQRLIATIPWSDCKRMHVYDTAPQWKEVEIKELVHFIQRHHPAISVVVPQVHARAAFPHGTFDVIIIPLLGYSTSCYRLGHGGGWYDRFLLTQPQALKIGVGYDMQQIDDIPVDVHDIALDKIITESRVITR